MQTSLVVRMACGIIVLGAVLATACQPKSDAGSDSAAGRSAAATRAQTARPCPGDNAGLTLPSGFCATLFADSLGHARHLVVADNGDVYVNTWSGRYYTTKPPAGGFLVALRDTNHDGRADQRARFGATPASGGSGGTGIALYNRMLYAEEGSRIVRYPLPPNGMAPTGSAETVVRGLPLTGDHPMHPFAIDSGGTMYMNSGSATNACQARNRVPGVPGQKPCTELQTRGGIWSFDAKKTNQPFTPTARYATGIRNAVGVAIGPGNALYSTQHGRDQLETWTKLYTPEQGQNLPAEELLRIEKGADFGWPYCYYDDKQQKLVLAPEYDGDGGKALGDCASKATPIAAFPAHWAPDGLLFYTGTAFPARYRDGAFIAFHGSWDRAPGPQGGYQVVFQPLSADNGSTSYATFANGFAGAVMQPDAAAHRPVGLAQGRDGALYIADDQGGRVWRVTYGTGK